MIALAYAFKFIALALGLAGIAGCAVLVWREFRSAPMGRQDAEGFHHEPEEGR